jgi:hypothetical protein
MKMAVKISPVIQELTGSELNSVVIALMWETALCKQAKLGTETKTLSSEDSTKPVVNNYSANNAISCCS